MMDKLERRQRKLDEQAGTGKVDIGAIMARLTREQMLSEEKHKLLQDIEVILKELSSTDLFTLPELSPMNLNNILNKLNKHIESEVAQINIPQL